MTDFLLLVTASDKSGVGVREACPIFLSVACGTNFSFVFFDFKNSTKQVRFLRKGYRSGSLPTGSLAIEKSVAVWMLLHAKMREAYSGVSRL
jgi:hypothetical protein